jgi:hypothetical protein
MGHRSANGYFVSNFCGFLEVFAKVYARDFGFDTFERPTVLERCIWFRIE